MNIATHLNILLELKYKETQKKCLLKFLFSCFKKYASIGFSGGEPRNQTGFKKEAIKKQIPVCLVWSIVSIYIDYLKVKQV